LLALGTSKLGQVDVARMNLLCAAGLPGAERLDVEHAISVIDRWAQRVAVETDRHFYRWSHPDYADHYDRNEAYYRMEMLVQVLQLDLGVKYDMAALDEFGFEDSRAAFIHGMIPGPAQSVADTRGGTCASMPVMYVAVGRRLGYPLQLVTTAGHVFVRWDGKDHANPAWRQRFNIEGAGDGISYFADGYYRRWPTKVSEREIRANGYLVSLTASEELALFLAARGHCALDNGQAAFAARCYENAFRYDPEPALYRLWFAGAALRSEYRAATPELAGMLAASTHADLAAAGRGSDAMFDMGAEGTEIAGERAPEAVSLRVGVLPDQTYLPTAPGVGMPDLAQKGTMTETEHPLGNRP